MIEVITYNKQVKARKDYRDNTREFIMNVWGKSDGPEFSPEEIALIEKAISENWIIKKGEIHDFSVNKFEGEIYSFRAKLGLIQICHKYELFPDY